MRAWHKGFDMRALKRSQRRIVANPEQQLGLLTR